MLQIYELLKNRRSHYGLDRNTLVSKEDVVEILENALDLTPSAFNAQTQRLVILFDEKSDLFWDNTREALREVAPEEGFENTIKKLEGFKQGIGTVLYYADTNIVKGLQEKFGLYADKFPVWAQQENAMLQLVIWTAFAEAGLGASLQHYNPVVDEVTRASFDIPEGWELIAQMPFGNPVSELPPKQVIEAKEKLLIK